MQDGSGYNTLAINRRGADAFLLGNQQDSSAKAQHRAISQRVASCLGMNIHKLRGSRVIIRRTCCGILSGQGYLKCSRSLCWSGWPGLLRHAKIVRKVRNHQGRESPQSEHCEALDELAPLTEGAGCS